ncbi:MAG TPA: 3-phosphoshikimate 1-carboxyvinyltransferase [Pyrinomonadaceae bacterium]
MIIRPAKRIRGQVAMPGDKSISHRAALIAALATGTSRLENFSSSADCAATLRCLAALGVSVSYEGEDVLIAGAGLRGLREPSALLDCGNSGTTMRLLAGILAGQTFTSTLTGDASLRSRPMQRIVEPLQMMGAVIESYEGRAPLTIQGRNPLAAIEYELLLASAQTKSCILLAGLNAKGRTTVIEKVTTRDHTERLLRWFGVKVEAGDARPEGEVLIAMTPPNEFAAREVEIPGDISAAAYFIAAAALLDGSILEIRKVGINPGRALFLNYLTSFGLELNVENASEVNNEPLGTIHVNGLNAADRKVTPRSSPTINGSFIAGLIDELPLLAVVGSQLEGGIEIRDARELRVKESDRIAATVAGLRTMGAAVEEFDDGLRVSGPVRLRGAAIDPRADHRIAMAFTVAALMAEGETEIKDSDCVAVSFPGFFEKLESVVVR